MPSFHTASVTEVLAALARRRDRRDALRALRGQVIRSELYALDGTALQGRPYTVTEAQYGLREESVPGAAEGDRRRIFFPFAVAQRTTQWERGDDPMTQYAFTDLYDDFGQAQAQTTIALPRRAARRQPLEFLISTAGQRSRRSTHIPAATTSADQET